MSSSAMGMHPTEVRQGKGKGKAQKQRPTMVSPYFSKKVSSIPFPSYLTPYDVSVHTI